MSTNENNSYEEDDDFIKVIEKEDSDFMEFPKEEDGTVLLRTIQTQFSNAIGLRYKGPSGAWRAVREVDDALVAPKGGWSDRVYSLAFSEAKKRKIDPASNGGQDPKYKRFGSALLKDLAVIGLPYKTTESELTEYFQQRYGEVANCQIKFDRETGKSKGFGFIRFQEEEVAKEALLAEHYIDGRRIQVREKRKKPMKMYVNGLPEGTTQEDLTAYFSQFGTVIDSYVPTEFRSFAFFTFSDTEDGRKCLREQHTFKDVPIKVRARREKVEEQSGFQNNGSYGARGNTSGSTFGGGYGNPKYNQPSYQGKNMPSQPPQSKGGQTNAAELKSMLIDFLSSPN